MSNSKQIQIDAGNTFVKLRLVDRGPPFEQYRLRNPIAELPQLFKDLSLESARYEVLISSVLSAEKLIAIIDVLKEQSIRNIYVAESMRAFGNVRFCYEDIASFGVDRFMALIGALHCANDAGLCVVDVGTAITVDVLNASGEHLGGFILPGMELMAKSLSLSTDGVIFDSSCESHSASLGCSTQDCVLNGINGVLWGVAQFVNKLCRERGNPSLVLTGGGAERFAALLADGVFPPQVQVEPDLIFMGLEKAHKQQLLRAA